MTLNSSIGLTSNILNMIAQRQKVLGTNIANVDTPGYVRKDVDFSQYLNSGGSSLETKMSQKLGSTSIIDDQSEEPVNAAQELVAMQENSLLYTMATRRMSNIITQMKTVLNVGK